MLIKDAQPSHWAGASEVKREWTDTTFRHREIKACNALSLVLPACGEWQCATLSLCFCSWQGAQGKLRLPELHTHTLTLFLTATDARLPSIALSRLKITQTRSILLPGKGVPDSPGGCQCLGHKNPMDRAPRKVNYMPVLSISVTLMEFALTQRVKIKKKDAKQRKVF